MADEKEKEKELLEMVEKLLVGDIPHDATLDMIKSKQAEIISKGRELVKKIAVRRKSLSELEAKKDLAERHYYAILAESNKEKTRTDRLSEKGVSRRVEYLVNQDVSRESVGIYEKIKDITNKIDTLMLIWKRNDDTADRIENMLNAQINIERRLKEQ